MDQFYTLLPNVSDHLALLLVFLFLLACGLGLPFPEEIPLFAAGYLVYDGSCTYPVALGVCMAGIMLGDLALFTIGNRMGLTVFEHRWFKRIVTRKRLRLSRQYFKRHGIRIVFFGRFVAGLRAPIFLTAAILRMRITTFFLIDLAAALISVPVLIYLAYYFGAELEQAAHFFRRAKLLLLAVLGTALIAFVIWRYLRKLAKVETE